MRLHYIAAFFALVCSSAFGQGEKIFKDWDKNGDGFLEKDEVPPGPRKIFDRKDTNGDGKISMQEHLGRGGQPERPERPEKPGRPTGGGGDAAFTIEQTWAQEPDGFERPVYVHGKTSGSRGSVPVIIDFHGGGGDASRGGQRWTRLLPDHLVVAPQGYERGWNVHGENSKAPDVSFFESLIDELGKRYPAADMDEVTLVGSSNGAAYIYRLLIELEEPLFKRVVPMVSSLLEVQYHDDSFWKSSDESDTDELSKKASPIRDGVAMLYCHGTDDKVVPFYGGLRFGKYQHLTAYETANIWARNFGYSGAELGQGDAEEVADGLLKYDFEGTPMALIEVVDGNHGLAPHRDKVEKEVVKFITGR